MPAVIGVYVGRLMKKKVVLTYHGGDAEAFFDRYPAFVKAVLMRTDANVVLSGFLEGVFHKIGAPCVIIPNLHDFKEGVYRRRNTISPSFISVRSHTATYNIECILRAFKKVCLIYPNSSLLVLGDGELHESLVEYVARENIANVSFVGRVDNADIYEYLGKADIMLSSPVVDNMPVSLLEAFNSGLLVISSRVGGVPYMMRDGVEGLMFTSCDSDELVIRMIEAFTNQEDSLRMAEAAHESLAQYQWESVRKKLLTIYG